MKIKLSAYLKGIYLCVLIFNYASIGNSAELSSPSYSNLLKCVPELKAKKTEKTVDLDQVWQELEKKFPPVRKRIASRKVDLIEKSGLRKRIVYSTNNPEALNPNYSLLVFGLDASGKSETGILEKLDNAKESELVAYLVKADISFEEITKYAKLVKDMVLIYSQRQGQVEELSLLGKKMRLECDMRGEPKAAVCLCKNNQGT